MIRDFMKGDVQSPRDILLRIESRLQVLFHPVKYCTLRTISNSSIFQELIQKIDECMSSVITHTEMLKKGGIGTEEFITRAQILLSEIDFISSTLNSACVMSGNLLPPLVGVSFSALINAAAILGRYADQSCWVQLHSATGVLFEKENSSWIQRSPSVLIAVVKNHDSFTLQVSSEDLIPSLNFEMNGVVTMRRTGLSTPQPQASASQITSDTSDIMHNAIMWDYVDLSLASNKQPPGPTLDAGDENWAEVSLSSTRSYCCVFSSAESTLAFEYLSIVCFMQSKLNVDYLQLRDEELALFLTQSKMVPSVP
eukprot:TRINITY_DN7974_c0_g1_i3.p1 TRINITY_DN7974_c0_g1~~TRINITY_DN7974_c0_g1_i3.p1  ORF type:complete len:311 (-),score=51.14 TRINITY_DN7974_c0_g1_i3:14-946(-)